MYFSSQQSPRQILRPPPPAPSVAAVVRALRAVKASAVCIVEDVDVGGHWIAAAAGGCSSGMHPVLPHGPPPPCVSASVRRILLQQPAAIGGVQPLQLVFCAAVHDAGVDHEVVSGACDAPAPLSVGLSRAARCPFTATVEAFEALQAVLEWARFLDGPGHGVRRFIVHSTVFGTRSVGARDGSASTEDASGGIIVALATADAESGSAFALDVVEQSTTTASVLAPSAVLLYTAGGCTAEAARDAFGAYACRVAAWAVALCDGPPPPSNLLADRRRSDWVRWAAPPDQPPHDGLMLGAGALGALAVVSAARGEGYTAPAWVHPALMDMFAPQPVPRWVQPSPSQTRLDGAPCGGAERFLTLARAAVVWGRALGGDVPPSNSASPPSGCSADAWTGCGPRTLEALQALRGILCRSPICERQLDDFFSAREGGDGRRACLSSAAQSQTQTQQTQQTQPFRSGMPPLAPSACAVAAASRVASRAQFTSESTAVFPVPDRDSTRLLADVPAAADGACYRTTGAPVRTCKGPVRSKPHVDSRFLAALAKGDTLDPLGADQILSSIHIMALCRDFESVGADAAAAILCAACGVHTGDTTSPVAAVIPLTRIDPWTSAVSDSVSTSKSTATGDVHETFGLFLVLAADGTPLPLRLRVGCIVSEATLRHSGSLKPHLTDFLTSCVPRGPNRVALLRESAARRRAAVAALRAQCVHPAVNPGIAGSRRERWASAHIATAASALSGLVVGHMSAQFRQAACDALGVPAPLHATAERVESMLRDALTTHTNRRSRSSTDLR